MKQGFIVLAFLAAGCGGEALVSDSRFALGTRISLKVESIAGRDAEKDLGRLFQEVAKLEKIFDPQRSISLIGNLNKKGFCFFEGPDGALVREVLGRGLDLARKTGGAFDPFILPLTQLWGFSSPAPRLQPPSVPEIAAALQQSGYRKVQLGTNGMRLPPGAGFDGGGYVKGFVVDRLQSLLLSWGYRRAIVDAGGDVALIGTRPPVYGSENGWVVMIAHPRVARRNWCSLIVRDLAVVTSGDYERFFFHGNKRYHHILDPATGYPASRCVSVTVIGPRAELSDALATAGFVLGYEGTLRLFSGFPGYGFMILQEKGGTLQAHFSPGFRERYQYKESI